jgi:hypothetical protein
MILKLKIMKKIFLAFAIASTFAACHSDSKTDLETNKVMLTDTAGVYNNNLSSDTGFADKTGVKPSSHNSNNSSKSNGDNNTASDKSSASTTSGSANNSTANTTTTTTTKKKGWSNKAKGAVIGGAVGAVGGAIISKHKGTGAVVGGVVGAAGGYIIGNQKDKKENK